MVNPENTFFSVKRFIGRRWDEVGDKDRETPYTVVKGDTGNVKITCSAAGKDFAAEEISAQVLRKLCDDAASYLGDTVTKAVITVMAQPGVEWYLDVSICDWMLTQTYDVILFMYIVTIVSIVAGCRWAYRLTKRTRKRVKEEWMSEKE